MSEEAETVPWPYSGSENDRISVRVRADLVGPIARAPQGATRDIARIVEVWNQLREVTPASDGVRRATVAGREYVMMENAERGSTLLYAEELDG